MSEKERKSYEGAIITLYLLNAIGAIEDDNILKDLFSQDSSILSDQKAKKNMKRLYEKQSI